MDLLGMIGKVAEADSKGASQRRILSPISSVNLALPYVYGKLD
jgi:hypothetical protein